jgi:hypothetical protein
MLPPALDRILSHAVIVATALMLLAAAGGCAKRQKPRTLPDLNQRLQHIHVTTAAVAKELPEVAGRIDKHAKAVGDKSRGKVDVQPELVGLATETANLRGAADRIASVPAEAKAAQGEVTQYTTAIDKLEARNDKLEEEKRNGLRAKGLSQIGFGGFAIFAGIVGLFTGTKLGKVIGAAVLAGGGALVVLGLVVGFYSAFVIIPVIVIAVASLGYYAWRFVVERRSTKDLTRTVEITKQAMPPEMRLQLFGNGAMPGIVDAVQSTTTKQEVRTVRQDPTVPKAPEIPPTNVSEPGTVPGPAVSVPTADVPTVAPAKENVVGDDANRGG